MEGGRDGGFQGWLSSKLKRKTRERFGATRSRKLEICTACGEASVIHLAQNDMFTLGECRNDPATGTGGDCCATVLKLARRDGSHFQTRLVILLAAFHHSFCHLSRV